MKRGYSLVFGVNGDGDFQETETAARKILSGHIDPFRIIRDACLREILKLKIAHGAICANSGYGLNMYSGTLFQKYSFLDL